MIKHYDLLYCFFLLLSNSMPAVLLLILLLMRSFVPFLSHSRYNPFLLHALKFHSFHFSHMSQRDLVSLKHETYAEIRWSPLQSRSLCLDLVGTHRAQRSPRGATDHQVFHHCSAPLIASNSLFFSKTAAMSNPMYRIQVTFFIKAWCDSPDAFHLEMWCDSPAVFILKVICDSTASLLCYHRMEDPARAFKNSICFK